MKVYLKNLQKRNPITSRRIKNQIRQILKAKNLKKFELSVVFVSDRKIKSLNKKFLSHNYPTDVLAFDLSNKTKANSRKNLIGEIIVSTDTAKRNAKLYNSSYEEEIKLYIIHGILHLLGYNDSKRSEIKLMRKKEQELLGRLK